MLTLSIDKLHEHKVVSSKKSHTLDCRSISNILCMKMLNSNGSMTALGVRGAVCGAYFPTLSTLSWLATEPWKLIVGMETMKLRF